MIRGKYLRERKAMRIRRRFKFLVAVTIVLIVYKILCDSFSLFESQAISDANIDIAFFLVEDNYEYPNQTTKRINIADIEPGETKDYTISVSNFAYFNDKGEKVNSSQGEIKRADTNIKYTLKVKTTTNLPLKYEFYVGESPYPSLTKIRETKGDNGIIFYKYDFPEKYLEFNEDKIDKYKLSITFPKDIANNAEYQGMIEYIEVSIDAEQVVQN